MSEANRQLSIKRVRELQRAGDKALETLNTAIFANSDYREEASKFLKLTLDEKESLDEENIKLQLQLKTAQDEVDKLKQENQELRDRLEDLLGSLSNLVASKRMSPESPDQGAWNTNNSWSWFLGCNYLELIKAIVS